MGLVLSWGLIRMRRGRGRVNGRLRVVSIFWRRRVMRERRGEGGGRGEGRGCFFEDCGMGCYYLSMGCVRWRCLWVPGVLLYFTLFCTIELLRQTKFHPILKFSTTYTPSPISANSEPFFRPTTLHTVTNIVYTLTIATVTPFLFFSLLFYQLYPHPR